VTKKLRNDYLLLAITIGALIAGLIFGEGSTVGVYSYALGAIVGLGLSIALLVGSLRHGEFGSDVLALVSIAATVLTEKWLAASVIAVMLATGRALERWAEGRARFQLEALLARAPRVAHLMNQQGNPVDVPLDQVKLGDMLLIRSGEVVPIDGTLSDAATFDTSALTGEPIPEIFDTGREVPSGVLNVGGQTFITTTRTSADSTYSALIRLVQQAGAQSATGVRIANKWAVRFVPFAMILALATWLISGSVDQAVAVIVAATPCPLILAVPVAIISGMSRAAANGAIIKGGAALEQLALAKSVLLDKTGTLTHGGPKISNMFFAPGSDESETLRVAASLEQSSPHIVAKAIVEQATSRGLKLEVASQVHEDHGHGVSGLVAGHQVRVGQPTGDFPTWAESDSALTVAIELDGTLMAIIGLDDPLRADALATVNRIRALGVDRVLLVSGDRKSTAEKIGAEVGVDHVFSECKPEDKLAIVRAEMEASTGSVIAVGDGINDAPALAAASVGVAMGAKGSTAASEAADVVIIEDSIKHLAIAISVAKGSRNRALQAAGIGMSLSTVAMLFAAIGLLDATASALTQELIDTASILWALVPVAIAAKTN
jgi:heavy metal translocating P-type ATPase